MFLLPLAAQYGQNEPGEKSSARSCRGASPDEFRTAPLWGVGQRVFFLHDGRTSNLVDAIRAHQSHGSEANKVIEHFNKLTVQEQQQIIDFLRSL